MSKTTTPAIEDLIFRSMSYPADTGANGFMYSSAELIALLEECTPRITVGVHDIRHIGGGVSVEITVYTTFDPTELEVQP